jgi:N,N-dimethylformamidase
MTVGGLVCPRSFTMVAWIWPTSIGPTKRGIMGGGCPEAPSLILDPEGHISLWLGGQEAVRTVEIARLKEWQCVVASMNSDQNVASVAICREGNLSRGVGEFETTGVREQREPTFYVGKCGIGDHFNGKIEAPTLLGSAICPDAGARIADAGTVDGYLGSCLARWEFQPGPTRVVADLTGNGHDGRLVNLPTLGVTGKSWSGKETDFRLAPEEYRAAHFHDDDLDDAAWDTDFIWDVPEGTESGVYAFELGNDETVDVLPLFVCPRSGRATASTALLLPTFSYLAYGNEHVLSDPEARDFYRGLGSQLRYPRQPHDLTILAEKLHSLYDRHSDGSGVSTSSWLRPILSMRPKYHEPDLSLGKGAAHQLNADLHLVNWLHEIGHQVDIITDYELHTEGQELLAQYEVVLTGTHPEYVSEAMLDGVAGYLGQGGRVMYLGGNGFYWVTELDPVDGHTIEVRRCGASTRLWEARPGEWHLNFSGRLGGLWRFRDRAPQQLFGVGFSAQGFGTNQPYVRTAASFREDLRFVFDGLGDKMKIGDVPALVNEWGAAGFEIDRVDDDLGTPQSTVVLATATEFGDFYQAAIDDVLAADSKQSGSVNANVRADMVLVRHPNGGAVFSPGSIAWCSCLSFNDYENDVARITRNVLDAFSASAAVA